jgi:prevent-host-death family protein
VRNTKEKTNIVGLKELRNNIENYINKVNKGQSFTIVRRSKPIFNITPVDEWGDIGVWKTIVDFTKFKKGGVRAEEVLASLKRLKAYE